MMSVDELRDTIWTYLYQADGARTLDEIAAFADRDRTTVCMAVDHEWFTISNDQVSIAYTSPAERAMF
jgi:hypothetical protein